MPDFVGRHGFKIRLTCRYTVRVVVIESKRLVERDRAIGHSEGHIEACEAHRFGIGFRGD
jgi:hypothetical protein